MIISGNIIQKMNLFVDQQNIYLKQKPTNNQLHKTYFFIDHKSCRSLHEWSREV